MLSCGSRNCGWRNRGEANFELCMRRGLYGCVMPATEWNKAEVVAGILSIQPNDLVFFYVKNRGVYGIWKVVGNTFFDDTRLWDNPEQSFPYRFTFEPVVGQFSTRFRSATFSTCGTKGESGLST